VDKNMKNIKLGIPLHGKMSSRAFHSALFRKRLKENGMEPLYFLTSDYLAAIPNDEDHYFELQIKAYEKFYQDHAFLRAMKSLRRFVVTTETTDLRLREEIELIVYNKSLWKISAYIFYTIMLRQVPAMGEFLLWSERMLYKTKVHSEVISQQNITCVLTPGMGNYRFEYSGQFALEAQSLGLPVFSAITNYDNVVNMGFRGFNPSCLAVWSQQMADDVMHLHRVPANKIEITGPIQYDRFKQPLPLSREAFLKSIGLDPSRKTILVAGGINITRYFEIYSIFVENGSNLFSTPYNLIIRPYPHEALLQSPGWKILRKLFKEKQIYLSVPEPVDKNEKQTQELSQDLFFEEAHDELSYLLPYSDVMVNYFSTIALEAAICDLPVIHVGYDLYTYGHRFNLTTSFQQRQTHNKRKLRIAASRVAKNESDLIRYVTMYLENRALDSEARKEYAVSECGELDGKSGVRLIEMIKGRL
jgi:hypothetical protein